MSPRFGMMAAKRNRGFTLVELMIVVAIVGVLSAVGVFLLNKHMFASKSVEASAMIQSIRAAQERWRAETMGYLNVSEGNLESWYPMETPGRTKWAWDNPDGRNYKNWRLLGPTVAGPVQFGYAVIADAAGTPPPALSTTSQPGWGTADEPWYVIQALADVDGDGNEAIFAASSFSNEIYSENEGE